MDFLPATPLGVANSPFGRYLAPTCRRETKGGPLMKRTSACLAALAFLLVASSSSAQTLPSKTQGSANEDPIGDLIAHINTEPTAPQAMGSKAGLRGTMAPIPDDAILPDNNAGETKAVPGEADWKMRVTLYHSGGGGAGARDSLGCPVVAMRTAATDPRVAPKRSIIFIPDTVGLKMPDGTQHDGYWYVSDTGGGVKGSHVDLFTGHGRGSMAQLMKINTRTVAVMKAGTFTGCPKAGQRMATAR
jgi:3D (Asp-Asp-Asp) domain-containing protein